MPNILRRLKVREISSVDRGAGEGVHVVLFKRALAEQGPSASGKKRRAKVPPKTLFEHQEGARAMFGGKPSEGPKDRRGRQRHLKREFSGKERERLASSGAAMPGGGYPIANLSDLRNAIQAIGRAKNPAETRAHVRSRARALGHTDLIPESWGKSMKSDQATPPLGRRKQKALVEAAESLGTVSLMMKGTVSFDQTLVEMSCLTCAKGVIQAVRDSCHALKDSIKSIADCEDMLPVERADAISKSFGQFMNHLSGIAPTNVTKALEEGAGKMSKLSKKLAKAFTSVGAADAKPPTKDKDVKVDNDADKNLTAGTGMDPGKTAVTNKQMLKAIKKLEARATGAEGLLTAALTMTKAEKDYMDDPDADMDEDKKKMFLGLAPAERTKFMTDYPLAEIAQKRIANLPEPVRRQLAKSATDSVDLAKRVEADDLREFGKRATDLGQPEAFGAHLRTLAKGLGSEEDRTKAIDEVTKALAAYAEQAKTAGLFRDFGTNNGATGTAWDKIVVKAEELRGEVAKAGGKALTSEMAFAKVYEDPANAELVKQYKQENPRPQ